MTLPLVLPALLGLVAWADPAPSASPTPATLELLDQERVAAGLAELAADPRAEAFRVGISRAGLPIDGVKLSSGEGHRPALLVLANLDADRVWTSALALELGRRLLADQEGGAALLAAADVYLVPRVDVDGAERRFELPLNPFLGTGLDRDTDRDGMAGEDGPVDVNGDGMVTMMRVPDVDGTWLADPHEPRASVEADPAHGERGLWKLMVEGLDADGDGEVAEDGPADGRLNHNFSAGFEDHGAEAGLFPGDEPGARALMDFVIGHPELVLVLTLDGQDTLVDAPDKEDADSAGPDVPFWMRSRELPDGRVLGGDADLLAGFGRTLVDLAEEHELDLAGGEALRGGSFQRWAYEHRGLVTLDLALWEMPTEAPEPEEPDEADGTDEADEATTRESEDETTEEPDTWRDPSEDAGRLAWMDAVGAGHRFVDWQPFDHPTLGAVEVGGWAPFALSEPPAEVHAALVDVHYGLLTSLADAMPAPRIASLEAEHLGSGLWRVEARLENHGTLPVITATASRARTTKPARATLSLPEDATIIAGEARHLVRRLDRENPAELEWLVHADELDGLSLELTTEATGSTTLTIDGGTSR